MKNKYNNVKYNGFASKKEYYRYNELMHILNRSTFPQYYTSEWNLVMGCHECHDLFDHSVEFRKKCNSLYEQVIKNVRPEDVGLVRKYFGKE